MKLRLASWNINGAFVSRSGVPPVDCEDLGYIERELRLLDAGVVCLQEVHFPIAAVDASTVERRQAEDLAHELGYGWVRSEPRDAAAIPGRTDHHLCYADVELIGE